MKLSNLFRRKPSREVAKDRLKILLISDRVNCSPEQQPCGFRNGDGQL